MEQQFPAVTTYQVDSTYHAQSPRLYHVSLSRYMHSELSLQNVVPATGLLAKNGPIGPPALLPRIHHISSWDAPLGSRLHYSHTVQLVLYASIDTRNWLKSS